MATRGVISRRLRTLEDGLPADIRRELSQILLELGDGDCAVFFTVVPDPEVGFRYASVVVVGDEQCREVLGELDGRPFDADRSWRPDAPPPLEVGRFTSLRRTRSPAILEQTESYLRYYVPLGVQDHARMLVYRGPELVGWVGVLRLGDRPRYGDDELRKLNAVAGEVTSALIACDARERLDERDRPATVLLRADGSVEYATEVARSWLDVYGTRPLRRAVAELDGDHPVSPLAVGIHRVRLVPMEASHGDDLRYLATIERAPTVSATPWARLPSRQRQVAQYAAAGATTPEIARALGVSPETVRSQLKSIYRALGIGSRAELATLVTPDLEE